MNNIANNGGCIKTYATQTFITNTEFINNTARQIGGAMMLDGSYGINYFTADNITCDHNNAEYGGCIAVTYDTDMTITNSVFKNNIASSNLERHGGGALYITSESQFAFIYIDNCAFISNHAFGDGGAIELNYYIQMIIKNSEFVNNRIDEEMLYGSALSALGMGNRRPSDLDIKNTTSRPYEKRMEIQSKYNIVNLVSDEAVPTCILECRNVTFIDNIASGDSASTVNLNNGILADFTDVIMHNNTAHKSCAISMHNTEFYCDNCEFNSNRCPNSIGSLEISVISRFNYFKYLN